MKRFFVVMLLLFVALFSFSACDMQKGDTDSSVQTEQGTGGEETNGGDEQTGGNETENNESEEGKPKPVKPITNGGNINFN